MQKERPASQISMAPSDRTMGKNDKGAVAEKEGKGAEVERNGASHRYENPGSPVPQKSAREPATQYRDDLFDANDSSYSAAKSSRSMKLRLPLPRVASRSKRSQSLRERNKDNSDVMCGSERTSHSGSTLVGTLGFVPKLARRYLG
jgi:hypothetical protein